MHNVRFFIASLLLCAGTTHAQSNRMVVHTDGTLSQAEYQVAQKIEVGFFPCEEGKQVLIDHDPYAPGFFKMQFGNESYRMRPIQTSGGTLRLEDPQRQMVWIQISTKSMLFNQNVQERVANGCTSPTQSNQQAYNKVYPPQDLLGGYTGD